MHAQRTITGTTDTISSALLDAQGSLKHLTDSTGTLTLTRVYDAWGTLRFTMGSATSRLGYTGELQDGSLVYLRARWYHTGLGTFTSRDTFQGTPERSASLHRYVYTENRPTMLVDPSGHEPVPPTPTPDPRCLHEKNQRCPLQPAPLPQPIPVPEPLDVAMQRQRTVCMPKRTQLKPSDKGIIITYTTSADTHIAHGGVEVDIVYDLYGFGMGIFTGPGAGGNTPTSVGVSFSVKHGVMWGWDKFNPPSVTNFSGVSWALSGSLPVRPPASLSLTYGASGDSTTWRPNFSLQWLMTGIGIDVASNQALTNIVKKGNALNAHDIVGAMDASFVTPYWTKDFRLPNRKEPVWQNGVDFLLFMQTAMPEPLLTYARPFVLQNMQYWREREWYGE